MKVTRIIQAATNPALLPVCRAAGFMRADIWRRYGGLGTNGRTVGDIRKELPELYRDVAMDGTNKRETFTDAINDIFTYRAAALVKVKRALRNRVPDEVQLKAMHVHLKEDWTAHPLTHRLMRKHFRHGVGHTHNQFIVRSDRHSSRIVDGRLVVTLNLGPAGQVPLVTTTNGKNVDLTHSNLRVIVKGDVTEIHYCTEKPAGRPHGEAEVGVDKGYTEALTDSDGVHHGTGFGAVMSAYSDRVKKTGQARGRLHALEKKHRAAGNVAKADRILRNNLGRKKLNARKHRAQRQLRGIAYQAAHAVVDKAALVVAEDLSSPIAKKQPWTNYNRRMSSWAKGVIAEALEGITAQRGAQLVLVNAAYTSQIDSQTGRLEGRREGDRFYHVSGDVSQADHNAARNALARNRDPDIGRYTPYTEVKGILLARSDGTDRQLARVVRKRQPGADKSRGQKCSTF